MIGKVVGINLKRIDFTKEAQLNSFVDGLNQIKSGNDKAIYISDNHKMPQDVKDYIESETELVFLSGENIRLYNIQYILKELVLNLGSYFTPSDTLIVCNHKDLLIKIITNLADYINFFTVVGIEDSIKEEVYEEVFQSTGISIFQPKNINKIIKNYGVIINFSDQNYFQPKEIRNKSIIIDYSKGKTLKYFEDKKKELIYIEDINLAHNIKNNTYLNKFISPELFEAIENEHMKKFEQIYSRGEFNYIKKFVYSIERKKGTL